MCEEVIARARRAGATVIVNDRADLARLSDADGVHVGQEDLPPAAVRQIVGGSAIVGLSTHSADQVRHACRQPVDYIAIGPVFGTATKDTGYDQVGIDLVARATAIIEQAGAALPLVAIGGITLDRAREVVDAGARCVAVISDLLSTGNPERRVREYVEALK